MWTSSLMTPQLLSSSTSGAGDPTDPIATKPTKPPSQFILQQLLERIRCSSSISHLKQIHAHLTTNPNPPHPSLLHALISSYTSSGCLSLAALLFRRYPLLSSSPTLWNILIQAYSKRPNSEESLLLFRRMMLVSDGPSPDKFTLTFVVAACSRGSLPTAGETVHGLVVKTGLRSDVFVGNSLVNMYSEFSRITDARRVFDEMPLRDVVSWTSLIGGYLKIVEVDVAQKLFELMPEKNNVSWAVLIAGYVRAGRYSGAIEKFHNMLLSAEAKPNEAILVSVLTACALMGALEQGRWIHAYICRTRFPQSSNISTALIDMYSKCGSIDCAKQVFSEAEKDVLTWTSMISGLAKHGNGTDALEVFHQMLSEGLCKPDSITLLGVLNACSHSGLVGVGCSILYSMNRLWGVAPKLEHFGCLIDLLGRAGRLEEAFEVVRYMPMEPDIVIWRAFLSACRIQKNVKLGEQIMDKISQLDPSSQGGGYALLSNLYAMVDQWDGVNRVKKTISEGSSKSNPGCSWIEVNSSGL